MATLASLLGEQVALMLLVIIVAVWKWRNSAAARDEAAAIDFKRKKGKTL